MVQLLVIKRVNVLLFVYDGKIGSNSVISCTLCQLRKYNRPCFDLEYFCDKDDLNDTRCSSFEDIVTYEYARTLVEKKFRTEEETPVQK